MGFVVGVLALYIFWVRGGPSLQLWHTEPLTEEFTAESRTSPDVRRLPAARGASSSPSWTSGSTRTPRPGRRSRSRGTAPAALADPRRHGPTGTAASSFRRCARRRRAAAARHVRLALQPAALRRALNRQATGSSACVCPGTAPRRPGCDRPVGGHGGGGAAGMEHLATGWIGSRSTWSATRPARRWRSTTRSSDDRSRGAEAGEPGAGLARDRRHAGGGAGQLEATAGSPAGARRARLDSIRRSSIPTSTTPSPPMPASQVHRLTRSVAAASRRERPTARSRASPRPRSALDGRRDRLGRRGDRQPARAPGARAARARALRRQPRASCRRSLVSDPGPLTGRLMADATLPFRLTLITNEEPESRAVVSRRKAPLSAR